MRTLCICVLTFFVIMGQGKCGKSQGDPFADVVVSYNIGRNGGFGEENMPTVVLGAPAGGGEYTGSLDVLSLGDGGEIIIQFDQNYTIDGPGDDFVIYENPFYIDGNPETIFIECGVVSVSFNGTDFVEFPHSFEINKEASDPSRYKGFAGIHPVYPADSIAEYGGDSFDLSLIGVEKAKYIKIVDTGTSVSDVGNEFNDAPSAGFDLDAVSILNMGNAE